MSDPVAKPPLELRLGGTLSKLLLDRKLTMRAVARSCSIPVSTFFLWTANQPPQDPVRVARLAQYFGVSLHFLLFGEEDRLEPKKTLIPETLIEGVYEITIRRRVGL